ncbi:hypothetical protein TNCV_539751 [Trichonephila clavipes]|nr:hypothetical protein TNCV_539751 [Trichonephila clavipes]
MYNFRVKLWETTEPPPGLLKIGMEQSEIVLSSTGCTQILLNNERTLAVCHDEFREPRSDVINNWVG